MYRHDWQLAGVLAILVIVAVAYVLWPRQAPTAAVTPAAISADEADAAQERTVIIYISGAVRNPGLYTVLATLRVSDAIVAAGGLTQDADPACMPNLAAHVKDAKQITVPLLGHCSKSKKPKLDINSATRDQLLSLPGMDAQLADAIITYRQDFGGFNALTELKSAMGLDATTYKQLAKFLTVP
ncbi:MAG TPA: ComEA family DNA-binding protein [Candidatus Dormibacteraeota bacterium]